MRRKDISKDAKDSTENDPSSFRQGSDVMRQIWSRPFAFPFLLWLCTEN